MKSFNRRRFLQLAGTGSIVAATAGAATAVPMLATAPRLTATSKQGSFTFRAVAGLPAKPLPSYASYVIEGHVNLSTRSGMMTKTVFAGDPQAMSTVALPGLSRIIRIADVQDLGGTFRIQGVIDDRSHLQQGESRHVDLFIDPAQRLARTRLSGVDVTLQLER
jgi:hypothetical protein